MKNDQISNKTISPCAFCVCFKCMYIRKKWLNTILQSQQSVSSMPSEHTTIFRNSSCKCLKKWSYGIRKSKAKNPGLRIEEKTNPDGQP